MTIENEDKKTAKKEMALNEAFQGIDKKQKRQR